MRERKVFDVLVINFEQWFGPARLPHVLAAAGCRVHMFTNRGTYAASSGYRYRTIWAPDVMPDFMDALQRFLAQDAPHFDWIIAADDSVLYELSLRAAQPWAAACLPVPPHPENLAFLLDKHAFPSMVMRHGLPSPRSFAVKDLDGALAAASSVGYPLIAKAMRGTAGGHIRFIRSDAELKADVARRNRPFVVQEFVDGQLCGVTVLYCQGELRFWAVFERVKNHPHPFGPSAMIHFIDRPSMAPLLQRLGQVTGFHGLCGFDFILRQRSGDVALLEQHGRPTPQVGLYLGGRHGALEMAIHRMLSGEVVGADVPTAAKKHGHVAMFPQDIYRSVRERDYFNLVRWLVTPARWRDIPWREPALLLRQCGLGARA